MTITYSLSEKELIRYAWRLYVHQHGFSMLFLAAFGVCLLISPPQATFFIGIMLLVWAFWGSISARQKIVKEITTDPRYTENVSLEFGDERVSYSKEKAKGEVLWSYFRAFVEDENYFFLITTGTDATLNWIIAKRAFGSAEEMEKFRSLAKEGIGRRHC